MHALQEVSALTQQHQQELALVVQKNAEALQLHQQQAGKELAEQGQAHATAEKALENSVTASKQAAQVCHCFRL